MNRLTALTPLKITILLLSAAWGIPWMHAAESAASIFHSPDTQHFFAALFAWGIVFTVGCDGLWLLLSVVKKFEYSFKKSVLNPLRKTHFIIEKRELKKWITAILCAGISCIPSVYATVMFNSGAEKFLGIVTFIGNMAYGLYGYSTLYENLFSAKKSMKWAGFSAHYRETIIIFFASIIAVSTAIVDFYLTKGFFQREIIANLYIASVLAMMTAIPGIVANFIASRHLLLKTYTTILNYRSINRVNFFVTMIIFLIALTAPSAAGYITFTTLHKANANSIIVYTATSFMIVARFLFSNFTMHQLVSVVALTGSKGVGDQLSGISLV